MHKTKHALGTLISALLRHVERLQMPPRPGRCAVTTVSPTSLTTLLGCTLRLHKTTRGTKIRSRPDHSHARAEQWLHAAQTQVRPRHSQAQVRPRHCTQALLQQLIDQLILCRALRRERRSVSACSASSALRFCAPAPAVGLGGVDARESGI